MALLLDKSPRSPSLDSTVEPMFFEPLSSIDIIPQTFLRVNSSIVNHGHWFHNLVLKTVFSIQVIGCLRTLFPVPITPLCHRLTTATVEETVIIF